MASFFSSSTSLSFSFLTSSHQHHHNHNHYHFRLLSSITIPFRSPPPLRASRKYPNCPEEPVAVVRDPLAWARDLGEDEREDDKEEEEEEEEEEDDRSLDLPPGPEGGSIVAPPFYSYQIGGILCEWCFGFGLPVDSQGVARDMKASWKRYDFAYWTCLVSFVNPIPLCGKSACNLYQRKSFSIYSAVVACTVGSMVFVSILLVRGIWAGISYIKEQQYYNSLSRMDSHNSTWDSVQPVS